MKRWNRSVRRSGLSDKGREARELLKTIRMVHAGETCVPAALLTHPASQLSLRQITVLELVVEGLSNKQIAYRLRIADTTARNHVKNILARLGVRDRTGLRRLQRRFSREFLRFPDTSGGVRKDPFTRRLPQTGDIFVMIAKYSREPVISG
jgi:DNA-binding CsgD family transcriptional regulator